MSKTATGRYFAHLVIWMTIFNAAIASVYAASVVLNNLSIAIGLSYLPFIIVTLIACRITKYSLRDNLQFEPVSAKKIGITFILFVLIELISVFWSVAAIKYSYVANIEAQNLGTGDNPAVTILITGLITPVIEEIIFRGIIFNSYKKCTKTIIAALASALFFALIHFDFTQMPFAFIAGLVFAAAYEYTGNFIVPVIMHTANNMTALLISFYPGTAEILKTTEKEYYEFMMHPVYSGKIFTSVCIITVIGIAAMITVALICCRIFPGLIQEIRGIAKTDNIITPSVVIGMLIVCTMALQSLSIAVLYNHAEFLH